MVSKAAILNHELQFTAKPTAQLNSKKNKNINKWNKK